MENNNTCLSFWNEIMEHKLAWFTLLIFLLIVFLVNLGGGGLPSDQEPRGAIIARNMIETGIWGHVTFHDAITTEKPVLCYWFYAVSGLIFGVNAFSVRLPSAIIAILTIFISCHLAFSIYGRKTALLCGYVLSTMIFFVHSGHLARIDIVLAGFYTLLMSLMYFAYFKEFKPNNLLYLFYIVLGLSALVKGPLSLGLIGVTVIIIVIIKRNPKIIWEMKPISGAIITLAVALPWFISESIRTHGAFARDFFLNQNISRFTGVDMSYKDGQRGSYFFYFPKLFVNALPWSAFVPFALFNYFKKFKKFRWPTYYLIIWTLVIFVFFTLAAIKRADYILPLYPALAILITRYIVLLIEKAPKLSKKWVPFFAGLVVLIGAALAVIRFGYLGELGRRGYSREIEFIAKRDARSMIAVSDFVNSYFIYVIVGTVVLLIILFIMGKLLAKGKLQSVFTTVVSLTFLGIISYYLFVIPQTSKYLSFKDFALQVHECIPPNASYFDSQWSTECIYYINRSYNDNGPLYDEETHKLNYKYWIANPEIYASSPEWLKNEFVLKAETVPGHKRDISFYVAKDICNDSR